MAAFVISAFVSVLCAVAAMRSIAVAEIPSAALTSAATLFMGFCTFQWLKRLQNPLPVAQFTPVGVTNERGEIFEWSRVTRIWKWTGVLFLPDDSKRAWVVRLDPAEVRELPQVIDFIKQYAPRHLTERL